MTVPMPAGVNQTFLALGRALDEALETGLRVPCREAPDVFFADTAAERRVAANRCNDCPIVAACRRYATAANESYGVWAGVDRESLAGRQRHAA